MVRGEYTVQEMEAMKQAGRDNSFRTCVLTMFIFLILCIILLIIAATWRPNNAKENYPHKQKDDEKHASYARKSTSDPNYETITQHVKHTTNTPQTSPIMTTTESHFGRLIEQKTNLKTKKISEKHQTTTQLTTSDTDTFEESTQITKSVTPIRTTTEFSVSTEYPVTQPSHHKTVKPTENTINLPFTTLSTLVTTDQSSTESSEKLELSKSTTTERLILGTINSRLYSITEIPTSEHMTESYIPSSTNFPSSMERTLLDNDTTTQIYETMSTESKVENVNEAVLSTQSNQHADSVSSEESFTLISTTDEDDISNTDSLNYASSTSMNSILADDDNTSTSTVDYSIEDSMVDTVTESNMSNSSRVYSDITHDTFFTSTASQTSSSTVVPTLMVINETANNNMSSTFITHEETPSSPIPFTSITTTTTTTTEHSVAFITPLTTTTRNGVLEDEGTLVHPVKEKENNFTVGTENSTVIQDKNNTCTSSACKIVASRMLSLMNHSADPCEDFYEFACGGLRDNRNLLQDDPENEVWTRIAGAVKHITSTSSKAFQQFRLFYDQCVSYDFNMNKTSRLVQVHKTLDNIGKMYNYTGWLAGNLNINLTALLVKLLQHNSAPLFDIRLDVDGHNTSRFLLKLTAPTYLSKFHTEPLFAAQCKNHINPQDGNKINLKDVYLNEYLNCTRDYGDYMNTIEKALKELGMFKDVESFNETQYITKLKFFIEFEILHHLRELPDAGKVRQVLLSKQYTLMSVQELQSTYPLVDWNHLLGALVGGAITPLTTIQLYFENYFNSLFDRLADLVTNNEAKMNLHNSLLAMFAHDLYVDLVRTRSPCAREDYCLKVASGLMEDVSSALYLTTFTNDQLRAMELELVTLFNQLKLALQEQFKESEWLDDYSRSTLTNKLQILVPIVDGGKAFLEDPELLNDRMSGVNINSMNSYPQNAVHLVNQYRTKMYSLYDSEPNRTDVIWSHFILPYDTQALTIYELNVVVIPFGLIGSPQFSSHLPSYIFKARVGNDLARYIVHQFDVTGIEYGSNGKNVDILSDDSKSKYDIIKECDEMAYSFEKSWTNHKHQIFSYQVDATQSMNERFADNGALQLSYKTFKEKALSEPLLPWLDISHNKLYHLLVAQEFCTKGGMLDYTVQLFESEHMPPFLRVANWAQNSEEFAEAYGCRLGSQMNPEIKCNSFPIIKDDYDSSEGGLGRN